MNGLSGSRVLLLDDEPREALPIIKALSRNGVPVVYFEGTAAGLPPKSRKLRGIRLAVLDMNLGQSGSDENIASTLVQTLSAIMSPDNGPYGVLIWTNHPDLKEIVARYIFQHLKLPKPVFIVSLKKADFLRRSGTPKVSERFSVAKFSKQIVKELDESSPLECMQVWEGSSFTAATNVTNVLAELTATPAPDLAGWRQSWRDELLRLLFVIGRAQAEQHLSIENVLSSMFLALNPLHGDRLDSLVKGMAAELSGYSPRIMAAQGGTDVQRKSRVNSMLHLAADHLERFSPGNLYVYPKRTKPAYIPSLKEVLQDCLEGNAARQESSYPIVFSNARLIALEITPVCDYAQNKMGLSRLIAGFLLPHGDKSRIKKCQFLKPIGPFQMRSRGLVEGTYDIYLNSRYPVSAKLDELRRLRPVSRVRSQLLADVQSWAGYQGSRQGVMMLQ